MIIDYIFESIQQMQSHELSSQEKLAIIHKNKQLIPDVFVNQIPNSNEVSAAQSPESIRLQTFFRLTQPIMSYKSVQDLLDIGYNQVAYPITAVIVFEKVGHNQKYYITPLKLIQWIQSGGTRCIPLKIDAKAEQVQKCLKNCHSLVVTDMFEENNLEFSPSALEKIESIIQIAHQQNFPTLFLGNISQHFLQKTKNEKISALLTTENNYSESFFSYYSSLLKDLELAQRIVCQNRKLLKIPYIQIRPSQIADIKQIQICGLMYNKQKQVIVTLVQDIQNKKFYLLNDPTMRDNNPQSINIWHKLITNFINQSKKNKKVVKQKIIQKWLIGTHKIIPLEKNKSYYKIV